MEPPGVPILRISAARALEVDLEDVRYLRESLNKWEKYRLQDGDLLFTRYNGSLALLGVCGVVRGLNGRDILYPDKLMRVRFDHACINQEYVELFFSSPLARDRMMSVGKTSAGQQGISGASVKAQALAVPPLAEQEEIVRRVSALLAKASELLARVEAASHRVDRSLQAVLAKAFRGELLPAGVEPTSAEPAAKRASL
jgi:type I restriction enzyme S subunit